MPPAKKPQPPTDLVPGVAVLLPDGGEAILLGVEDGFALLRCGTVHHAPVRRPAGQVSVIAAADETARHAKFRAEAIERGEIELSEPASAE